MTRPTGPVTSNLNVTMTEKMQDSVVRLLELTDAATKSEVFRRALEVYEASLLAKK